MINTAAKIANDFWLRVGKEESFPRELERSVSIALPIAIVALPKLSVLSARSWLAQRRVQVDIGEPNRALRACLVAHSGKAIIFLDGTDPPDERRFSIAHELAHFLVHYLAPREAAIKALGDGIVDGLDGLRPFTVEERLSGVVAGVPIGSRVDLMVREHDGYTKTSSALAAEDLADEVAVQLLAPDHRLRHLGRRLGIEWDQVDRTPRFAEAIVAEFGLPSRIAVRVARRYTVARRQPSVRSLFGI